ncbi:MAG: GDP-mannose 4,6-dehydratase, partial [Alkalispirochaeta sp.]
PISPYAATKKAGELLCHTYAHLHGMRIAALRFFTVYGPRQRPDLAIAKFTKLIDTGRPIPVYGDGSTRRDYTYVADTVDGIVGALAWVREQQSGTYDVFNLGESRTVSLSELISALEDTLGRTAQIDRRPLQPGDVEQTWADITRAREAFGYDPQTTLAEGLESYVNWYRAHADTEE